MEGLTKQFSTSVKSKLKNVGKPLLILSTVITLFFACGKETSSDGIHTPILPVTVVATGSLKTDSTTNNCLPSNVSGVFLVGTKLYSLNYLEITINVKKAGTYSITTPLVNGIYFTGSGTVKDSGLNTIKLAGVGTPVAAGVNTFAVTFSGTTCYLSVTVAPVIVPTSFSINCSGTAVNGSYFADSALNVSNNITLPVTVSSLGSYSITSDSVNGIIFNGTGVFTSLGNQTVTLTATGKPLAVGTFNFNINSDSTICPKTVTFAHK
jgi:hypothetical protein